MSDFGCVNNTILCRSGTYFDLANPDPKVVCIGDIAGALAKICRFGGQCPRFYSVAEHCCLCCEAALYDDLGYSTARLCLLHDAAEAYVGDVVKPLKSMLRDFAAVEAAVEQAISQALDLQWTDEALREVKRIDHEMLIAERLAIFRNDGVHWAGQDDVRIRRPLIRFYSPAEAEERFLRLAFLCNHKRKGGAS